VGSLHHTSFTKRPIATPCLVWFNVGSESRGCLQHSGTAARRDAAAGCHMNVVEMKDRRRRVDRVHHIVEAAIAPGIEDRPCVAASAFSSNSWRHFREVDSAPA
jgi:hypothetical protein